MNSQAKKVAFIANSAFTLINFRKELIGSFIEKGYEVIAICPIECGLMGERNIEEALSEIGVRHISIKLSRKGVNPISELLLLFQLFKILRKEKPELVMNYTIKPVIYGSIAAKIFTKARIFSTITGLGFAFTNTGFVGRSLAKVIKLQYSMALRFNETVFFQNSDDLSLFNKLGLVSKTKTKIINGSGVNLERFNCAVNKNTLKREPNSFIMIARILKDKGVAEYINAARIVKREFPNSKFILLGAIDDNPASYKLEDVEQWQNEGVIEYIGPQTDVRPYLFSNQVFVLPSYREGTPRSVLEAMAMEMPIITTNAPGCKETVENDINGYLVDVESVEQLTDAIKKFIDNPTLILKMGKQSLEIARRKYDVNRVNQDILSSVLI